MGSSLKVKKEEKKTTNTGSTLHARFCKVIVHCTIYCDIKVILNGKIERKKMDSFIHGEHSDANTKVYRDGHAPFGGLEGV